MNLNVIPYWDISCQLDVQRESPKFEGGSIYPMGPIDPGIKFFVLAIEELGGVTEYSCEGHPNGAYVSFKAPSEIVRQIHYTDTFFMMSTALYSRSNTMCNCAMYLRSPTNDHLEPITESERVMELRQITEIWVERFGNQIPKLLKTLQTKAAELPHEQWLHQSSHPAS